MVIEGEGGKKGGKGEERGWEDGREGGREGGGREWREERKGWWGG